MTNYDRYVGKCKICGKEFTRKRISKDTCSDACRKKLSRRNIAERRAVSDLRNSILYSLECLESMIEGDFDSYEVARAIGMVERQTHGVLSRIESHLWACQRCGKISSYEIPEFSGDCHCTENPSDWVLQKKFI